MSFMLLCFYVVVFQFRFTLTRVHSLPSPCMDVSNQRRSLAPTAVHGSARARTHTHTHARTHSLTQRRTRTDHPVEVEIVVVFL